MKRFAFFALLILLSASAFTDLPAFFDRPQVHGAEGSAVPQDPEMLQHGPQDGPEDRSSGGPRGAELTSVTGTEDPGLYVGEHWGMRAFSCKIPNGKYLARLYFAETFAGITGPGQRVFSFHVQGHEFTNFDIWERAGGFRRAYVETVPVEVTEGEFRIVFTAQIDNPAINAIEIVPQAKDGADAASVPTAIRIKAGRSTPFTDSSGVVWQPDRGFEGGRLGGMLQARGGFGFGRRGFGGAPGGSRGGPGYPGSEDFAQSFLKHDTDGSGSVSAAELPESYQFLVPGLVGDSGSEVDYVGLVRLEMFIATEPDGQQLRDALLAGDPLSPQTVTRLQEVLDALEQTRATNRAQIASVRRSEWYSYAFTVTAMLIGVMSFGHLLSNPPPRNTKWTQADTSPDATRPVLISLGLICVLSLIDLLWTTAKSGYSHFQEMNPLGSQLLLDGTSPIVFKATTLAVSVFLLFVLRRYRGAQLASWWMCMVCTLLTFRWIVLDSTVLS